MNPIDAVTEAMARGAMTAPAIARATGLHETTVDALLGYLESTGTLVRRVEAMCTGSCSLCGVAGECTSSRLTQTRTRHNQLHVASGLTTLTLSPQPQSSVQ